MHAWSTGVAWHSDSLAPEGIGLARGRQPAHWPALHTGVEMTLLTVTSLSHSIWPLKHAFNHGKGLPRLVALVSPT